MFGSLMTIITLLRRNRDPGNEKKCLEMAEDINFGVCGSAVKYSFVQLWVAVRVVTAIRVFSITVSQCKTALR